MHVTLMRHPAISNPERLCYGRFDMPLASGWQETIRHWRLKGRVYSSPSRRCLDAARFIAAHHRVIIEDARLMELDFGSWEGRKWDDLPRADLDAWAADIQHYRPGGGESAFILERRVRAFWQELQREGGHATIVSHGGPLKILVGLLENRNWEITDSTFCPGEMRLFKV